MVRSMSSQRFLGLCAAACLSTSSPAAHADKANEGACIEAHADAQRLRKAGKLRASRDKLLFCASPQCPSMLVMDCSGWLADVEREVPTIVLGAHDGAGHELARVRVLIDGAL